MQVQYIDLSQIVQYVKAPYLKKSIPFVISYFLSAMVSPERRLNPGFGFPFPWIEVSLQKR